MKTTVFPSATSGSFSVTPRVEQRIGHRPLRAERLSACIVTAFLDLGFLLLPGFPSRAADPSSIPRRITNTDGNPMNTSNALKDHIGPQQEGARAVPSTSNLRAEALQFRLVLPAESSEAADKLPYPHGRQVHPPEMIRVSRKVLLDGSSINQAGVEFSSNGRRQIVVQFTPAGAQAFTAIWVTNLNPRLAIVYRDQVVLSVFTIRGPLRGGKEVITDDHAPDMALTVVDCLNRAMVHTRQAWTFRYPVDSILPAFPPSPPGQVPGKPTWPSWLDLDSDHVDTHQTLEWETRAGHDWIATNGMDVVAEIIPATALYGLPIPIDLDIPVLMAFDMVLTPAPTNGWETVTAGDVVQDWQLNHTAPRRMCQIVAAPGMPNTYLFLTREGGRGILQILGLASEPGCVKIRYKLAGRTSEERPDHAPVIARGIATTGSNLGHPRASVLYDPLASTNYMHLTSFPLPEHTPRNDIVVKAWDAAGAEVKVLFRGWIGISNLGGVQYIGTCLIEAATWSLPKTVEVWIRKKNYTIGFGRVRTSAEVEEEVRRVLSEGVVIWSPAEAHAGDESSAASRPDEFIGEAPDWTLSVSLIRRKGRVGYWSLATPSGGPRYPLPSGLSQLLFDEAAKSSNLFQSSEESVR